jgi:hypothetical protein
VSGVRPPVELVLAEFGLERSNAGKADLSRHERLNPTLSSFRELFPDAPVTLYTDAEIGGEGIEVRRVDPPFERDNPRYGWRASNYYQAKGILDSAAGVAVAMDADMRIVSPEFRRILPLASRFGLCVPANSRLVVAVNARKGHDSDYDQDADPTRGTGFAYNHSPMACAPGSERARRFLETYLRLSVERPQRGTHLLWLAAWESGVAPFLLPFNWCVCSRRTLRARHLDGNEIVLHVGHPDVEPHYQKVRRGRAGKR